MADSRVMRHLALVALVLIGIFIYAGFRIRHLAQKSTGTIADAGRTTGTEPATDSSNSPLATAEPARPAPAPKPDAIPAPALPVLPEKTVKTRTEIKPPPLPAAIPSLQQQEKNTGSNNNSLGGKTPAEKIKPQIPGRPGQDALPPLPPVVSSPPADKPHRMRVNRVKPRGTQSGKPQTPHTPSIAIEADGAVYSWYKVKPGDTLSGIARRLLGSSTQAKKIFAANRNILADSDHLSVGMRLRIPGWKGQQPQNFETAPHPRKNTANPGNRTDAQAYRVKPGDTLCGLAFRFYGTSSAWRKIHEANRAQIPNPNRLQVGVKLVIPGKK